MKCPQCGFDCPPDFAFCPRCGTALAVSSPPPAPPPPAAEVRGEGQDALLLRLIPQQYAERLLATRGQAQAERRLVTILFSDVKGSTAMAEEMDPEDWMDIMNGAFEFLMAPIYRHEGTLARLMGDAILAFFGAPLAREDDPERAIRAALEIVAGAGEYAARLERERGISGFGVRVGINTGLVVVGEVGSDLRVEYTAMGDAVNLAARLEQAAPVGGVLISHDTYRHVRGLFEVVAQEPLTVKGKKEPVQTYIVLRAQPRPFRAPTRGVEGIETRMVGRTAEMRALQEAFGAVVQGKAMRWITVVGDAGVGKSRLVYEFERWLERQPDQALLLKARAIPETSHVPYALLRDLFRLHFDILDSDPLAAVRDKFERGMAPYLAAAQAQLAGQLIGFDFSHSPAVRNLTGSTALAGEALAALNACFHNLSAAGPTIILLEDLHWADHASLDFFAQLAEALPDRPLLLLAIARPTLFERRPDWSRPPGPLGDRGIRLDLPPLSPEDSQSLVAEILQKVEDIPTDLERLILSSAEGNPFYVEEVVKMLIEDGVIVRGAERWQVQMERLQGLRVPPTLTGVLQARLDSLPGQEKEVLQRAAVVGRIFWDRPLEEMGAVAPAPVGPTPDALTALSAREMVFPRQRAAFAETQEYIFKHAVLRDVTYETVLLKLRRAYHRRVAEWLERQAGERRGEFAGLIAEHYDRAGERALAAEWFKRATVAAQGIAAYREAAAAAERALALLPEENRADRADLLLRRGHALEKLGEYPAARQHLQAGLALARELGDAKRCADILLVLVWITLIQGEPEAALSMAVEALDLARQSGDTATIARATMRVGGFQESGPEVLRYYADSLALFRQAGDRHGEAVCLLNTGNVLCTVGDLEGAARCYQDSLAIYQELGNRWGIGNCLGNLGGVAYDRGDYTTARRHAEEYLAISRDIGDREGIVLSTFSLGRIAICLGDYEAAWTHLRAALREASAVHLVFLILRILGGLADLCLHTGRPVRAAELLGTALGHSIHDEEMELMANQILDKARQSLPPTECEAALERGRARPWEEVVAEILAEKEAGDGGP